jgi:hypothetical protein
MSFYNKEVKDYKLNIVFEKISGSDNYIQKLKFATTYADINSIEYIMKHDNDHIMSCYMYDFIFENLYVLNNPKNAIFTVPITTGIPTLEYFIDDFLTNDEQSHIRNAFYHTIIPNCYGADYSSLNSKITNAWDYKSFFNQVSELDTYYKGVHPLRFSVELHNLMTDLVISHATSILSEREFTLYSSNDTAYFCCGFYCIKTSKLSDIINKTELFVDNYEEVPLNRLIKEDCSNIVFVRNGCAVHSAFNSIPDFKRIETRILDAFKFRLL